MRRLLIIGCGDVVRRVLPQLVRRWRIYALVREWDPALRALGVVQIVGDLDRGASLTRLVGLAQAVLHSAPPGEDTSDDARTRRLIAVLRQASLPRRLVYISTSGVYGDCAGDRVFETRRLAPRTARARRRVAAEAQLRRFGRESGCAVSILRAPGIYAADRLPLERLRRGLPLLLPEEDIYTNHIHAEDLGRACVAALECGAFAGGRAYNAVDDSDITMGDWFGKLADAFALPHPPRVSRAEAERVLPPVQLSFMRESRRLDNTRLKRELRLRLRYPTVDSGIAAALEDKAPHPPAPAPRARVTGDRYAHGIVAVPFSGRPSEGD
ncbi:NAD-dependent epimerase/dehydratase family protein [Sulfurisoma sediminicola]|uniref:Nucleoside-diphosphate-sugar epimerase n=1 Tax=Sulfurisoma sediminicola TaxID=1381557 RepID=A0A497XK93_9PROT|nr:NAD-dependent epimerase/dehydratase family protein [Sulfurisoma sediminicola]RLJ68382.1 nucleoside-diphosphate-sugar epimerase [Sulfurisoma sediminicola]